jgi:hypothetical protein
MWSGRPQQKKCLNFFTLLVYWYFLPFLSSLGVVCIGKFSLAEAWETFCELAALVYTMSKRAGKLAMSTIQENKTIIHMFHV